MKPEDVQPNITQRSFAEIQRIEKFVADAQADGADVLMLAQQMIHAGSAILTMNAGPEYTNNQLRLAFELLASVTPSGGGKA